MALCALHIISPFSNRGEVSFPKTVYTPVPVPPATSSANLRALYSSVTVLSTAFATLRRRPFVFHTCDVRRTSPSCCLRFRFSVFSRFAQRVTLPSDKMARGGLERRPCLFPVSYPGPPTLQPDDGLTRICCWKNANDRHAVMLRPDLITPLNS